MKSTLVDIFLFIVAMFVSTFLIPLFLETILKVLIYSVVKLDPFFRSISIFICGIEAKIISLFGIADDYDYCGVMHKSYNANSRYIKKN